MVCTYLELHCMHRVYWLWWGAGLVLGSYGRKNAMSVRTIEAAGDVWEFSKYLANSLLFLPLGFELALTKLVQSFTGIFFGLLGALIGHVLMIYIRILLQDVLARWWVYRTRERPTRLPRPRPAASGWRPVMVLSGLRGALSLARTEFARSARSTQPAHG